MRGLTPEVIAEAQERCAALSWVERDVVILSAKGLHAREIGALVGCSGRTVETIKRRCFEKLQVETTVEAAVLAAKAGIV